jgi:hypothetical protein
MRSVSSLYKKSLYLGLDQSWVEEELEADPWRLNVWFEDLMYVVQWYPECDWYSSVLRSIAKRRLVKKENPSACQRWTESV